MEVAFAKCIAFPSPMLHAFSSSSHGMREEFVAWELLLVFKILNESQITLRIRIALLGQAWLGLAAPGERVVVFMGTH